MGGDRNAMRYYELDNDGYVLGIGTGDGGTEISEERYDAVMGAIAEVPDATETTAYRLKIDLTWEAYPVDPPDPDEEIDDADVMNILLGGAE